MFGSYWNGQPTNDKHPGHRYYNHCWGASGFTDQGGMPGLQAIARLWPQSQWRTGRASVSMWGGGIGNGVAHNPGRRMANCWSTWLACWLSFHFPIRAGSSGNTVQSNLRDPRSQGQAAPPSSSSLAQASFKIRAAACLYPYFCQLLEAHRVDCQYHLQQALNSSL
jgi:hypothetical protein